jgi:hypothetical protein
MMRIFLGWLLLAAVVQAVFAQGSERILAIDLNEAQGMDYQSAFELALDVGVQNVNLTFDWRDLEATPGQIASDFFPIINLFYPAYDMPVSLFIRPISTNNKVVPSDLMEVAFDDPQMIERFKAVIDYAFAQTPDTRLTHLIIGSEIDAYLGTDATLWGQYTLFFREIRDYIKTSHPEIWVTTEGLFDGMMGDAQPFFDAIHEYADGIGVSYYPLDADFGARPPEGVHDDFAALVEAYGDKPIHFFQLGYPSSKLLNSSEELQAQFIREVFAAWDSYAEQIVFIEFTWLHDISSEAVAFNEDYYGFKNEAFAAFLGTLGLRSSSGVDKLAFIALREEAESRQRPVDRHSKE